MGYLLVISSLRTAYYYPSKAKATLGGNHTAYTFVCVCLHIPEIAELLHSYDIIVTDVLQTHFQSQV